MKLGTGLFTAQKRPDGDRSMTEVYDEIRTLTREAEAAGLDSVWVSEHHFQEDGYLSAPFPTLGAMAAESSSIELGTCIALAPLYDPVRLAEDAATLDLLSDGRSTLGLAIGSNPSEFEQFGVPREERVERLEDTVSLLRAAWSEGPLDYDAAFHDVDADMSVTPKPERRLTTPDGNHQQSVPVMLGGAAKPAVRRAARNADAWCAPSKLSIGGLKKRVTDIRNVREEEGLDGEFSVYIIQHGFVGESREAAWEAMEPGYFYIQRRYAEIFSGEPVDSLDADRKEELREQAVFGTPEQVILELETYREALSPIVDDLGGDLHMILRTYHPGIGTEAMADAIQLLGDEVAPAIR
jgi:alkanesulfonate monooxygenase SsuD/methylene tetrahydromethanopterin reductase-like flavin-dependent oxidoreductase (luciferase family)